jgi:hypothetical protein
MILAPTQQSKPPKKIFLMGYSGYGKTSVIAPLCIPNLIPGFPGLKLRVLDFDGVGKFEEVLRVQLDSRLAAKKISPDQHAAAYANVDIEVCRENTGIVRVGKQTKVGVIGQPTAWTKAISAIDAWSKSWSLDQIVVIDSLTFASTVAVVNYCQAMNGRLNEDLTWREFSGPQGLVKTFLGFLADLPTNVIVTAHQEPLEIMQKSADEFITKPDGSKEAVENLVESVMAPISIGSKGRVSIPAGFNHLLVMALSPKGERRLFTQPADGVQTKSPLFSTAEKSYPIEDGLVRYWMLG